MILLAVRFVAELLGLAALGYVGATAPAATPWRIVLAIAAPLALAVVWALLVAPKADNPLPLRARELLGTAILVAVGVALAAAGQPGWGIAFAAVVLADQALILALGLDDPVQALGAIGPVGRD